MKLTGLSLAILSTILLLFATLSKSSPLSTSSRWIVDAQSGSRVKLRCGNWVGHLHAMLPEGLNKQPLKNIAANVSSMGFNCVRLTYAIHMVTKPQNRKLTVAQSLEQWNLKDAIQGVALNNPQLLNLTLLDAQWAVVDGLGAHDVMVVLDNHVSFPVWCCADYDGNGFFQDKFFDPKEWVKGLTMIAKHYKGNPTVVGMSLRNELRGPRQNATHWHYFMKEGATAVHKANEDVLVIVSGLRFDVDLSYLKQRPLEVNLDKKLVYEAHWYPFSDPAEEWLQRPNQMCSRVTRAFADNAAFLLSEAKPFPLFLSEFGINQANEEEPQNRYFNCLLADVAEKDLDWALWTLQGSYMLRENKVDIEESYAMFDGSWSRLRNPTMQARLQVIKQMIRDPFSKSPNRYIIYHMKNGQCVGAENGAIYASDCQRKWSRWSYRKDGVLRPSGGSSGCLTVAGEGLPATLSHICSTPWKSVSMSGLQLAAKDANGKTLCLERNAFDSTIVTKKCVCLDDDLRDVQNCTKRPDAQWFKLVLTNKK